jgi:hypothetical protein
MEIVIDKYFIRSLGHYPTVLELYKINKNKKLKSSQIYNNISVYIY